MTQPHLGLRIGATLLVAAFPEALARPQESQVGGLAPVHRMLPLDRTLTTSVVLADVDLDGDVDLVTGNRRGVIPPYPLDGREMLYLNDGTGRFEVASECLPKTESDTREVVCGDVDGDGDPDLVVANEGPNELWLNDGSRRFAAVPFAPSDASNPTHDAALGDVDLDGDEDLLLARDDGPELWLNDGAGSFSQASVQPPWSSYIFSVGLGDVDADGDLDALVIDSGDVHLWLNDGTGVFTPAPNQIPGSYVCCGEKNDQTFADVDGDGDPDALIAGLDGWAGLWLNDGQGTFTDASASLPRPPPGSFFGLSVAAGDLDGDGSLDFVLGGEQLLIAYINDGHGTFQAFALNDGPSMSLFDALAVALADLDGDGDDDVIAGISTTWDGVDVQERIWLGQHGSTPVEVTAPPMPEVFSVRAMAAADVEGDGDQDVFVGLFQNWPSGPLALLENDGSGGFVGTKGIWPKHTLELDLALATGDVDGDGDPDVVAGGSQTCRLFLNDGHGDFEQTAGKLPELPLGQTYAVAIGDVDGDLDLDLLVARQRNCRLWLNDGAGHFHDASDQLPDLDRSFSSLSVRDLDGDHDQDLLLVGWDKPSLKYLGSLWLNDGTGSYSDASSTLPFGWSAWLTEIPGDVDGDGDIDVVVQRLPIAPEKYAKYGVLVNDGSAHFDPISIEFPRSLMLSGDKSVAALLDADGDSDLDLVLSGLSDSTMALLANDGFGHFELPQETRPDLLGITVQYSEILPVELDGDGDLDLVVGSWGSLRVLSNLSRQITWRSVPRVGEALTFDLYGQPNAAWTLYVATEGELAQFDALAAPAWRFAARGTLDENGHGEWTFDVPSSPTLAGATWLWRATIGQKPSNFERTTFLVP